MRWRTAVGVTLGLILLGYSVLTFAPQGPVPVSHQIPSGAQPMIVVEVLSGDTVVLASQRPGTQVHDWGRVTIRLLSVDAPNFGLIDECFAVEAQGALNAVLPEGSIAWMLLDQVPKDDNGRWLSYLWSSDGTFVNLALARSGFVRPLDSSPNSERYPLIAQAGEEAAKRSAGLWGEC